VISASSASVYGTPEVRNSVCCITVVYLPIQTLPLSETATTSPISPYANSKLAMEGIQKVTNKPN
jgi:UDP-glucose 4-epimerase